MTPTPADIYAALDVVVDIGEESDSVDFEEAVYLMDALDALKERTAEVIDLLKMQMLAKLEDGGPRDFGGRLFKAIDDKVKRFDHKEILRQAAIQAFMDDNGEIRKTGDAVELLATTMMDLYLAPSSKAKVGVLDRLGIDRDDVIEVERKGRKVFIKDERET